MLSFQEFNISIQALVEIYPHSFPQGKLKIIYQIVKDLDSRWLSKTVRHFITHFSKAPVPADFHDLATVERKSQKSFLESSRRETFKESVFSKEEITEMFSVLKEISVGKINKKDAYEYAKMVQEALEAKGVRVDLW